MWHCSHLSSCGRWWMFSKERAHTEREKIHRSRENCYSIRGGGPKTRIHSPRIQFTSAMYHILTLLEEKAKLLWPRFLLVCTNGLAWLLMVKAQELPLADPSATLFPRLNHSENKWACCCAPQGWYAKFNNCNMTGTSFPYANNCGETQKSNK